MNYTERGLVSVLMAVYNGEAYIHSAISSILSQEYGNFELLIINDGSTDRSRDIIANFNDPRIRLLENSKNEGLHYTRTLGVKEARGQFIAIQDCDDISFNNRLKDQVNFLTENKHLVAVGSSAEQINAMGTVTDLINVVTHDYRYIPALLLFSNLFINSSMMFRSDILKKYTYRAGYSPAEDYDLIERVVNDGYHVQNIGKSLIQYRVHGTNISSSQYKQRLTGENKILKRQIHKLGVNVSSEEIILHHSFLTGSFTHKFVEYQDWLLRLKEHNRKTRIYKRKEFAIVLYMQIYKLFLIARKNKVGCMRLITTPLLPLRYMFSLFRVFIKK